MKNDEWWKKQIAYLKRNTVKNVSADDLVAYKRIEKSEDRMLITVKRTRRQRRAALYDKLKPFMDVTLWVVAVGGFILGIINTIALFS